jgi:hypothetical protein
MHAVDLELVHRSSRLARAPRGMSGRPYSTFVASCAAQMNKPMDIRRAAGNQVGRGIRSFTA